MTLLKEETFPILLPVLRLINISGFIAELLNLTCPAFSGIFINIAGLGSYAMSELVSEKNVTKTRLYTNMMKVVEFPCVEV